MPEDINKLQKFIDNCKNCKFATCEQCEINYSDVQSLKNLIARYKEVEEEDTKIRAKFILQLDDYILKSKAKEKIDSKFKEAKGLYERGVQPQAQFTMKLLRDLEKDLLEES